MVVVDVSSVSLYYDFCWHEIIFCWWNLEWPSMLPSSFAFPLCQLSNHSHSWGRFLCPSIDNTIYCTLLILGSSSLSLGKGYVMVRISPYYVTCCTKWITQCLFWIIVGLLPYIFFWEYNYLSLSNLSLWLCMIYCPNLSNVTFTVTNVFCWWSSQ